MSIAIVLFLAGLVLVVSLYDYFSSKNWQQVTSVIRNEVVFSDRNKEYGAYEIRRNYDRNIIFIILGVIVAIGVSYGAYVLIQRSIPEEIEEPAYSEFQAEFEAPPEEEEEILEEPPVEEPPVELEKQLDFREFEITDEVVETRLNTQEDVQETKAGNQNLEDVEETFKEPEIKQPVITERVPDKIETFVEEEAEFPGGYAEMMRYFGKNMRYPEIAVQAGIEGRANVRFVVEKDGSIGQVTVQKGVPNCPECDKEAIRVIKSMPKWKPGKNGGKAVRSYFSMPVTFKLQ